MQNIHIIVQGEFEIPKNCFNPIKMTPPPTIGSNWKIKLKYNRQAFSGVKREQRGALFAILYGFREGILKEY
jgi:hypothetical protein